MPRYAADFLVRCSDCDLVYAGRLPSEAELSAHYASYPATTAISDLTVQRFSELLDRLETFRETSRILDVGCGDGHFLSAARARGWKTYGSEYGEAPRQRARERGLDVRPAPFRATADELSSFDVVTSIEVIEHVRDPREEVARMAALLRPAGALYFTTPNFDSLSRRIAGPRWRAIEYPEHLNLFTARTLHQLLIRAGASKLELRTTGISPADIRVGLRPNRTGDASVAASGGRDQVLRSKVAGSPALDQGVALVNAALSRLRLGDTIKALYQLS